MSQLITQSNINLEINKEQALISHVEIARQTTVEEVNTKELIEKYIIQLEQVGGKVRFETVAYGKTKQLKKIYLLNEQHSHVMRDIKDIINNISKSQNPEMDSQFVFKDSTDWVKQFLDDFIQGTDFIIDTVTTVDVQADGHRVG